MGFMRPSTLFVSGAIVHLQALRTAWARRVLKPAEGYSIASLESLKRAGQATTMPPFVSMSSQLRRRPPSMDMVKQTVTNLIATGLVYKMGDHLFVSVPAQVEPKAKVAVECQTGMSIIAHEEPEKKDRFGFITRIFSKKPHLATTAKATANQALAFSSKFVPNWDQKLLAPTSCRYQTTQRRTQHVIEKVEHRRHPKCERIQITSSSECLDYGPIDPPECLPGKVEVIEDMRSRRKRRIKRKEIRTSTPVEASDSAYSVSPVQTDSNEERGSWSEPDDNKNLGLLKKRGSDKILKPKQEGFRGECEVNVYKLLARALRHSTSGDVSEGCGGDADSDGWPGISMEDAEGLARMTPRFYGLTSVPIDKKDVDFLILEDVTSTYSSTSHIGCKNGQNHMHCKDGKIVVKDKEWGKSYDEYSILDGLLEFFSGRGMDSGLISEALSKLDRVRQWFAKQTSFHFYASSLLFVYENDSTKPPNVQLVMIDFSHVFPSNNQLDTNYIAGLNELHSKVKSILERFSSMSASQTSTIENH
ncbi:hypothetical protein OSTOST_02269 [Ostertagia ostertagi]